MKVRGCVGRPACLLAVTALVACGGGARGGPDAARADAARADAADAAPPDAAPPDAAPPDAAPNDDSSLAALGVSVGALSPAFASAVTTYDLAVPLEHDTLGLVAIATVPDGAQITIDGVATASGAPAWVPLAVGSRDVDVVVTAASGSLTTYRVHVVRGTPVIELSYAGGALPHRLSPAFDPAVQTYSADVGLWLQQIQVTVVPEVEGSTITVAGVATGAGAPSPPVPLNLGITSIPIVVTDPGGAATTYTVNVTRAAAVLQQAYAKASNTDANDIFGCGVALWGDTLAVAANFESSGASGVDGDQSDNSASSVGAVYVFTRTGSTWTQQAYLKPSNPFPGENFGGGLALEGDTLAVGAPGETGGSTGVDGDQTQPILAGSGAVYVFTRTGTTWTQQAYLKASNTGEYDQFGGGLALSGDTLAVSAGGEHSAATGVNGDQTDDSAKNAGAVYVFTRFGSTWWQQAYIKASNTGAGDQFGSGLALWGDTLAVGAWLEDSAATGIGGDQADDSAADAGAVYVFTRTGATWTQQAYVKASNAGADDHFGFSVALWGDTLAVGAPGEASAATGIGGDETDDSALQAGAIYVFTRAGTTWSQQAYVKASNTDAGDELGGSVALWGDTLAVGAQQEDSGATGIDGDQGNGAGAYGSGAAYVFERTGGTWAQVSYIKASNTESPDAFGFSVALWGDTLAAGAWLEASAATGIDGDQADDSAPLAGAAYVFR